MLRRLLAATLVVIGFQPVEAFAGNDFHSLFSRGINIHDAMNWGTLKADKSDYISAPFSDAAHPFTSSELQIIRKAGFDFVRLTIDVGPLLKMTGPDRQAIDTLLVDRVKMALAADLSVIVDFHPSSQVADYSPVTLVADADGQLFHQYCDMVTHTAVLLDQLGSPRVALELMNEPQVGWSKSGAAKWQKMLEALYTAGRRSTPKLKLILTGGDGGNARGLINVDPSPFGSDPEAIFTFHYYYPYDFTMQSVPGEGKKRLELDIPYPADARPTSDSLDALKKLQSIRQVDTFNSASEQAQAFALVEAYHATHFSKRNIEKDFSDVAAWGQKYKIPSSRIYVGEFGVTRRYGKYNGARDAERALWLADVGDAADKNGYSWSLWAYRGYGGMGLTKDDNTEELDPAMLEALKLTR